MKRALLVVAALVLGPFWGGLANGLIEVHYYPAWINHWEDAGPLVAKYLGFYEEVGLDVTIFPGGPDLNPLVRMLNDRTIAFATSYNWLVLIARIEQGVPFKVIATDFQDPALHLVSWIPIKEPADLAGKIIEVWPGYEHPLLCFLGKDRYYYPVYGGSPGRNKAIIQNQGASMERFLAKQVDASHAMVYNELLTVIHALGFKTLKEFWLSEDKPFYVYRFEELDPDLAWDENSLVTTEIILKEHPEVVRKFVMATYKGWQWVLRADPEEVFQILLTFNDALDKEHEIEGGMEINKLLVNLNTRKYGLGYIDPEPWQKMAERLYLAGFLSRMPTYQEIIQAYQWIPSGIFPPE